MLNAEIGVNTDTWTPLTLYEKDHKMVKARLKSGFQVFKFLTEKNEDRYLSRNNKKLSDLMVSNKF